MNEEFPILAGALLGVAFAAGAPPLWLRGSLVMLAGLLATFLSGEFDHAWAFALMDCCEVATAAWIAAELCDGRLWRAPAVHGRAMKR